MHLASRSVASSRSDRALLTVTDRSLEFNSQKDYREKYEAEMKEIRDLEIWRAGKAVR